MTIFGKKIFHGYFDFLVWPMSHPLTWRRQGFLTHTEASHQGASRCFGFTFGELSCRPSLYTIYGVDASLWTQYWVPECMGSCWEGNMGIPQEAEVCFVLSLQYYMYELLNDGSDVTTRSPSAACPFAIVSFSYTDTKATLEAPQEKRYSITTATQIPFHTNWE